MIIDVFSLPAFQKTCLVVALGMLLWDTIEVGRNDAANLTNAVLGARVLTRRAAVFIAGLAVVAGAALSSDVVDTARKGIFDPTGVSTLEAALAIYISVYIVDTVLLYGYSAFGMPVSTTACLVFELLGAAAAVNYKTIHWDKAGVVMLGIFCSIVISGFASFLIQRAARGAIRTKVTHLPTLLLHGGWIGGGMAAGLSYFLLLKGMKNVGWIADFKGFLERFDAFMEIQISTLMMLVLLWGFFGAAIHMTLVIYRKRAAQLLFSGLSILGMIALAFAFGQNDLANCASPGLSAFALLQAQSVEIASKTPIAWWMLLICGIFLFVGMTTKNSTRVTKAAIAAGSMGDHVALWAPRWCVTLATRLLRFRGKAPALSPRAGITKTGKTVHYDTLRACVITSVSASVIATASSLGLPVSTTYVAFAAVIATGLADRIYQRGDAELKLGRSIWVVTSWMLSAIIAACATFVVALAVNRLQIAGIIICLVANLVIRRMLKKRADDQFRRVADEAYERMHPEEFADENY